MHRRCGEGPARHVLGLRRDATIEAQLRGIRLYNSLRTPARSGFNVLVPAIPEICTYGETLEEAREMARDAIRCYLESALIIGEIRL